MLETRNSVTLLISRGIEADAQSIEERLVALCAAEPGLDVVVAPDLYHLPEDSRLWDAFTEIQGDLLCISWLHPRPAEWLMRRHGIQAGRITTFSFGAYNSAETCFAAIRAAARLDPAAACSATVQQLDEQLVQRWYPIIDASRCINCQHCLQFCLWGVYELDPESKVRVTNPDRCKAGCPACSRICPQGAIMFPRYKDPAIAGAPGTLMQPDLPARKMFYMRTKKVCPVCANDGTGPVITDLAAETCQECGRPVSGKSRSVPLSEPLSEKAVAPFSDLDSLIDELDRRTQGRT